jgi:hypothetical protein
MQGSEAGQKRGRGKRLFLVSIALILFFVCSAFLFAQQPRKAEMIQLGKEFELKINQQAMLEDESLAVEFVSVLEDSRCPEGVDCIWSGNAKIKIKLDKKKQTPATTELNTDAGPKSSSYLNYEVKLVALKPRTRANEAIKPSEYKATLMITKK